MIKIYLIRHGQSEWNVLNKIQGQVNTELTELGRNQGQAIGDRLMNSNIDVVYSSDLNRALDTAKIIAKKINKPLVISESLREINFGVWEGLTGRELRIDYKEEQETWRNRPEEVALPGAESLEVLSERVMKWMNSILKENCGKDIAIVSHSATLKIMLLGLLDMPLTHYKNFTFSNVGLSIVELRNYNNVLINLNDISHLEGLL